MLSRLRDSLDVFDRFHADGEARFHFGIIGIPLRNLLTMSLVCGLLLCNSQASAQSASASRQSDVRKSSSRQPHARQLELGRMIFEKEWEHRPPAISGAEARTASGKTTPTSLAAMNVGDGLGPMFNATSCEACHLAGGASGVEHNVMMLTIDPRSPIVAESLRTGKNSPESLRQLREVFPGLVTAQDRVSIDIVVPSHSVRPLYEWIRNEMKRFVAGGVDSEWFDETKRTPQAIAERPVLAGRNEGVDFYLSQRSSPPLFGAGLINQISTAALERIANSQRKRTGGRVTGRVGLGKFGWRGQTATLQQFVRGACAGELGLQLPGNSQAADLVDETYQSKGFDMSPLEVHSLIRYVSALRPPVEDLHVAGAEAGKRLFAKIGCAVCHVENLSPARGLYSDLLLHDMGRDLSAPSPAPLVTTAGGVPVLRLPQLASSNSLSVTLEYYGSSRSIPAPYPMARPERPQFPYGAVPNEVFLTEDPRKMTWDRFAREWRTPPLWGVADSAPYLHDGRAETLDAAIRWHAGEASFSAQRYRSLSSEQRDSLLAFLRCLKAPRESQREAAEDAGNQQWLASFSAEPDPRDPTAENLDEDSPTQKVLAVMSLGN